MKPIMFILFIVIALNTRGQNPDNPGTSTTSFNAFFAKFTNHPAFQISHTVFPFKVINVDDEGNTTKFVQRKDWKYISFKARNVVLKQIWSGKTKVDVQFQMADTGIEADHYFEYRKGQWWQIYAKNESD